MNKKVKVKGEYLVLMIIYILFTIIYAFTIYKKWQIKGSINNFDVFILIVMTCFFSLEMYIVYAGRINLSNGWLIWTGEKFKKMSIPKEDIKMINYGNFNDFSDARYGNVKKRVTEIVRKKGSRAMKRLNTSPFFLIETRDGKVLFINAKLYERSSCIELSDEVNRK